jgi:tetratricopeptide (TPR) repeat protein
MARSVHFRRFCAVTILNRPEPDRSREPRRWTVQPAPIRNSLPFEGANLLNEVRPAAFATLLWHCLRAVQLWTGSGIAQRRGLFSGLPPRAREITAEAAPSELTEALDRVFDMMEQPEISEHRPLAAACRDISTWAAQSGLPATESEFADAVAYVLPKDADAALFAGRGARRAGALDRAQQWYHRASGLARRNRDKQAFVLSLIRRGTLAEERGNSAMAKQMQERAWKAASRYKLDKLAAYAQHELLVIAVHAGTFEAGQRHATTALRLYGRFDERFPQLAHDTAFLWAWHGYHGAAIPVFEAVLPFLVRPGERIQVAANIGRASAATGDSDGFFRAWSDVEKWTPGSFEYTATALLNLALGAHTLGLRMQASELARTGLDQARARGQLVVAQRFEALLENLSSGSGKDLNLPATPEMVDLAATLISRLQRGSHRVR